MPDRYHPLQPGDRTQGQGGLFEDSPAADRRPTRSGSGLQPGENAAPEYGVPETPLYKIGYLGITPKHTAPFEAIYTEGDTSGTGTETYELNIREYGDAYDPTAPARQVDVTSKWLVDTDHDGSRN